MPIPINRLARQAGNRIQRHFEMLIAQKVMNSKEVTYHWKEIPAQGGSFDPNLEWSYSGSAVEKSDCVTAMIHYPRNHTQGTDQFTRNWQGDVVLVLKKDFDLTRSEMRFEIDSAIYTMRTDGGRPVHSEVIANGSTVFKVLPLQRQSS